MSGRPHSYRRIAGWRPSGEAANPLARVPSGRPRRWLNPNGVADLEGNGTRLWAEARAKVDRLRARHRNTGVAFAVQLDTSILMAIHIRRDRPVYAFVRYIQSSGGTLLVSPYAWREFLGMRTAPLPPSERAIRLGLLRRLRITPVDPAIERSERFAWGVRMLRVAWPRARRIQDVLVAATAFASGHTVVTQDAGFLAQRIVDVILLPRPPRWAIPSNGTGPPR
jgi:predicted nucleic acid-binding protein